MLSETKIIQAEKVFRTIYNLALERFAGLNAWTRLGSLATEVPSEGPEEDYRWLGSLPVFKKWLGDISAGELADFAYTIKNEHFAAGVDIDSDELADDRFGIIRPRIEFLAVRALQHRGQMVENLILNGTVNLAYDGVAFFADAAGKRTIDNLGAGTISLAAPTIAQVENDIDLMRQTVIQFKDDKGVIIGLVPTVFAGPTKLERYFLTIRNSTADPALTNAGAANPFRQMIDDYIPLPNATDFNDVYGFVVNMPVKPFVFQNRQETDRWLDATMAKRNRLLRFGADYRAGFGYSLPHLAIKLVSAAA
jgi:hypothetical protein